MTTDNTSSRRFAGLDFEGFRQLASDPALSKYERIGFPDSYRAGFEQSIFADIKAKLPALEQSAKMVLDIGPGCSDLPRMLIALCGSQGHELVLVDSPEMLALLPEGPRIHRVHGPFPACRAALHSWIGRVDALICYSVLQYVFADGNVFDFVDTAAALLAPGGRMLLGDVPNASRRRRFLASAAGEAAHRIYTGDPQAAPDVRFNEPIPGEIDDAVVLGLLARARSAGLDAWIVPQPTSLPMANRREDILIERP
jgi:hypothetical protein